MRFKKEKMKAPSSESRPSAGAKQSIAVDNTKQHMETDTIKEEAAHRKRQFDNPEETLGTFIHWYTSSSKKIQRAVKSTQGILGPHYDVISEHAEIISLLKEDSDSDMTSKFQAIEENPIELDAQQLETCKRQRAMVKADLEEMGIDETDPRYISAMEYEDELQNIDYIELDMFQMSSVIPRIEQLLDTVEAALATVSTHPVARHTVPHALLEVTVELVKKALQLVYCTRDIYRLGIYKMFPTEVKQDQYFQAIRDTCDKIEAIVTPQKTNYVNSDLNNVVNRLLYYITRDITNRFMLKHVADRINKRRKSPLCPPARCTTSDLTQLSKSLTNSFAVKDQKTLSRRGVGKNGDIVTGNANLNAQGTSKPEVMSSRTTQSPLVASCTDTTQKYKWPLINTTDDEKIDKEKQLHSLMSEIDTLMGDVGLNNKKRLDITYEVLMMRDDDSQKVKDEVKANDKGKKQGPGRDSKRIKKRSNSERFIEDLDRLLDSCE